MQMKLSRRQVLSTSLALGAYALASPVSHIFAQQRPRRTPDQIVGPFYPLMRPLDDDADLLTVKGRSGRAAGQIIYLSGRVFDLKANPVSGAVVEIWQANTHGRYTHPNDRNPSPLDPNFEGYGTYKTEADGRFRFKTIKPGSYLTPSSGVMRTPHIHFQVTSGPIRFVTQMYFEGEKLNDTDSELQSAAYKDMLVAKILPPTKDLEPNSLIAHWDIILIRS